MFSIHPQPHSSLYLILSLVSGATSLYFFHDDALLFLAWYLLIIMAEIHENYGRSRTFQVSKASQISGTALPTPLSQLPSSNETGGPLEPELSLNLPAWPPIPAPSTDTGQTWQSSLPPSELYQLPLDEHLPVEILNINRWSLIQRNSRRDAAIFPELPAEDFVYLETAIDYDAINRTEDGSHELRTTHNEKESGSVCKSPSISKERRREKIHSLRSGLKTSIHDFASELKDGLESRRRAKSVLEAKERERTRTVECTSCFVSAHNTPALSKSANDFLSRTISSPQNQHY
jgi:hypothetical protein